MLFDKHEEIGLDDNDLKDHTIVVHKHKQRKKAKRFMHRRTPYSQQGTWTEREETEECEALLHYEITIRSVKEPS